MLEKITKAAETFSTAMEQLDKINDQIEKERTRALQKRSKKIKSLVEKADSAALALEEMVRDHPELFEKPKTRIVNNVKFGFRKIPDTVGFDDVNTVASLIKQHLGEKSEVLVKYSPKISKSGLKNLTEKERDLVDVYEIPGRNEFVLSRPNSKDLKDFVALAESL